MNAVGKGKGFGPSDKGKGKGKGFQGSCATVAEGLDTSQETVQKQTAMARTVARARAGTMTGTVQQKKKPKADFKETATPAESMGIQRDVVQKARAEEAKETKEVNELSKWKDNQLKTRPTTAINTAIRT